MRVKDELVRREKQAAERALDAFRARRIVAGGQKAAATAPRALVMDAERKVLGKPRRRIVAEEGLAQALRLAARDHAAAARADRHGAGPAQDLQLDGRALDAGDAERHAPVVDLIVAERFEESVGDLGETEALLGLDVEGDDRNAVEEDLADLIFVFGVRSADERFKDSFCFYFPSQSIDMVRFILNDDVK